MRRGDYDHNHAQLTQMQGTLIIVVLIIALALGGLFLGVAVID